MWLGALIGALAVYIITLANENTYIIAIITVATLVFLNMVANKIDAREIIKNAR